MAIDALIQRDTHTHTHIHKHTHTHTHTQGFLKETTWQGTMSRVNSFS